MSPVDPLITCPLGGASGRARNNERDHELFSASLAHTFAACIVSTHEPVSTL